MRITLIGPVYPYRGGIAHYNSLLATALQKKLHDVQVVSFERQYPAFLYPGKSDKDPSQQTLVIPALYLLDPIFPWTWLRTIRRIMEFHPDLVIIQWWTTFWSPALSLVSKVLRGKGRPVVFIIHNVFPHEAKPWDRWLARVALSQASHHIVQSEREKLRLEAFLPDVHPLLYPHPAYDMFSGQQIPKSRAKSKIGLPPEIPILLFFGIVRPYKGLKYLIDAVAQLHALGTKVCLSIAGEFWGDEDAYRQQIRDRHIEDYVFIDNRYIPNEDIGVLFSAADIFIAPYIAGTQSGAVKMAIGFGLPLIVSDKVALDPGEIDGIRCVTVPSSDPDALARAIEAMLMVKDQAPFIHTHKLGWNDICDGIERIGKETMKPGDG